MSKTIRELSKGKFGKISGQYSIEIEAEFSTFTEGCSTDFFSITADHSLMDNGREFVSRRPTSPTELKKEVARLLDLPDYRKNYKKTPRQAIHIHANMLHYTPEQVLRICLLYYMVEHIFFDYVSDDRKDNLYSLPMQLSSGQLYPLRFIKYLDLKQLENCFGDYKYSGLNVCSLGRIGTLEFRHLEGTSDKAKIFGWIDLIDNLIKTALSYPSVDALWEAYDTDPEQVGANFFCRGSLSRFRETGYGAGMENNYSEIFSAVTYEPPQDLFKAKKKYFFLSEEEQDNEESVPEIIKLSRPGRNEPQQTLITKSTPQYLY